MNAVIARDVTESGNTSAASIPLAFSKLVERGALSTGDQVLLFGFGGNLSYAGQVVRCPWPGPLTYRARGLAVRAPAPAGRSWTAAQADTQVKRTPKPWYCCPCRRGEHTPQGGRHLVRVAEWQTR